MVIINGGGTAMEIIDGDSRDGGDGERDSKGWRRRWQWRQLWGGGDQWSQFALIDGDGVVANN